MPVFISGFSILFHWFIFQFLYHYYVVVVQSPSIVQFFLIPWTAACQASSSLTIFQSLPKFLSIASVMSSSHLILWCSILLLTSIFPIIRDFYTDLTLHIRWPKHCLDYCTFIIESEVRKPDSSRLTFLSQEFFGYLRSYVIPYKLYIYFLILVKNVINNLRVFLLNL